MSNDPKKTPEEITHPDLAPKETEGAVAAHKSAKKHSPKTPKHTTNTQKTETSTEHLKVELKGIAETVWKRHYIRKTLFGVLAVFGMFIVGFGAYAYSLAKNEIVSKEDTGNIFSQVQNIIDDSEPLQGEEDGMINIALFGNGGKGHPGGGLTDTIMVASIEVETKRVALISIPRDLVVAFPSEYDPTYVEYRKINSAYVNGDVEFAMEKVTEVTGLPIHYYALIDFTGFRDAIDQMGGIDVYVDNTFTDYQYPDYNYGYQTIHFDEGWNHFDGETALQYSRSRKGNNGEGSDIKRAVRQQKVLEAAKETMLSSSTLLNPVKISNLLQSFGTHVSMNIEPWEIVRFMEIAQEVDTHNIITRVIDNDPATGLVHSEISSETGAYVLIPNAGLGKYDEIQAMVSSVFFENGLAENVSTFAPESETTEDTTDETTTTESTTENTEQTDTTPTEEPHTSDPATVSAEGATVVAQNGTLITGLATKTAEDLNTAGVDVTYGNAIVRNQSKTILFDLSSGQKEETRALLEQHFSVEAQTATIPVDGSTVRLGSDINENVVDLSTIPDNVDFIILLGANAADNSASL